MLGGNVFGMVKIGDGPGHTQHAVVSALAYNPINELQKT